MASLLVLKPSVKIRQSLATRRCSVLLRSNGHLSMQRKGGSCRLVRCGISQVSQRQQADALFSADSRPIILFDGVCNLCNGGVNMVLDNDPNETLRFSALQSDAGRALLERSGRSPDDISSIVLVEKDRSYIKSEAVLRIAKHLRMPFPVIAGILNPLPRFLRDVFYDSVADNRYNIFGRTNKCRLTDESFGRRFIEQ